jgi:enoyl-CoA hydratase
MPVSVTTIVGIPLVDLGTIRLPRIIGHGRAMDLILSGRSVDAVEALAMGLINRCVPDGAALPAAIEQWGFSEDDAIANEISHGRVTVASGETAEGAKHFGGGAGRHGKSV